MFLSLQLEYHSLLGWLQWVSGIVVDSVNSVAHRLAMEVDMSRLRVLAPNVMDPFSLLAVVLN